jgi:hypothetical protein
LASLSRKPWGKSVWGKGRTVRQLICATKPVTITDVAENTFVGDLVGPFGPYPNGVAWIGGSDAAVEGQWRWVDGPEAGDLFWNGAGAGGNIGAFANCWHPSEPNSAFTGEDALTIG